jgi:hypothetical protein
MSEDMPHVRRGYQSAIDYNEYRSLAGGGQHFRLPSFRPDAPPLLSKRGWPYHREAGEPDWIEFLSRYKAVEDIKEQGKESRRRRDAEAKQRLKDREGETWETSNATCAEENLGDIGLLVERERGSVSPVVPTKP